MVCRGPVTLLRGVPSLMRKAPVVYQSPVWLPRSVVPMMGLVLALHPEVVCRSIIWCTWEGELGLVWGISAEGGSFICMIDIVCGSISLACPLQLTACFPM